METFCTFHYQCIQPNIATHEEVQKDFMYAATESNIQKLLSKHKLNYEKVWDNSREFLTFVPCDVQKQFGNCSTIEIMRLMWLCFQVHRTLISNSAYWYIFNFFSVRHFMYLALYCYTIMYRHTQSLSRGTLLKYSIALLVTVRRVGRLLSRTISFASSAISISKRRGLHSSLDQETIDSKDKPPSTRPYKTLQGF